MVESLSEMPPNILLEILSRLPIKSVFAGMFACKDFLCLTSSNPHFNSLISSNTTQSLIIQFGSIYHPSKLLYLVDSELDTARDFGHTIYLKPIFQIPQYMSEHLKRYGVYGEGENDFLLVNSCNGLLCFAEQHGWGRSFVCNPITNEYAPLPDLGAQKLEWGTTLGLWLGFSEGENQYKVLRIFFTLSGEPFDYKEEFFTQVHVIGSCSWRDIEDKPPPGYILWDTFSVFLNGVVYWLCRYPSLSKFILFFDFEKEKFGEILPPRDLAIELEVDRYKKMSIGLLGGNLCVSDNNQHLLDIWFMNKRGSETSWTKVYAIDTRDPTGTRIEGSFRPLQILRNGEILMIWNEHVLVCSYLKKKIYQSFKFRGETWLANVVVFTPSFVPLKDTLMVDGARVQSMGPRGPDRAPDLREDSQDEEEEYMPNLELLFSEFGVN